MINPEVQQARTWLMENRPDLNIKERGRIAPEAMEAYRSREEEVVDGELVEGEIAPVFDTEEVAPEKPVKKGRLKKFFSPKVQTGRGKKREPVDGVFSMLYSGASYVMKNVTLKNNPDNPQPLLPIARVMEMQAPAVGLVIDDAMKGTFFDRMFQPIARTGKAGQTAWAVAGPPLLVAGIMANPSAQTVFIPMLREAMKSWVLVAGPQMRKAADREKKLMEELGQDSDATIDAMIQAIFAPPESYDNSKG